MMAILRHATCLRMAIIVRNTTRGGTPTRMEMAINARNSTRGGTPTRMKLREMGKAFPYSIVMDNELYIHECGDAIRHLVPFPIDSDTRFPTIATIRQPIMSPIAEHILSFINSIFIIDIVHTADQKCIPLKGREGLGTLKQ
ncbi:hypothetical protein ACOMHN_024339 [Nucella lapillus]